MDPFVRETGEVNLGQEDLNVEVRRNRSTTMQLP